MKQLKMPSKIARHLDRDRNTRSDNRAERIKMIMMQARANNQKPENISEVWGVPPIVFLATLNKQL